MKKEIYLLFSVLCAIFIVSCTPEEHNGDGEENPDTAPEEPKAELSIRCDGKEVETGTTIRYEAVEDILGAFVAGHTTEPVFSTTDICRLEVAITIPENRLEYVQWCGISEECMIYSEAGTYTRVREEMTEEVPMAMHAYFKAGISDSCLIKVDVRVDNIAERSFQILYVYNASENEEGEDGDEEQPDKPVTPDEPVAIQIRNDGREIEENEVIRYEAVEDASGYFVAGDAMEPVICASDTCRLEVTVSLPEIKTGYIRWSGIGQNSVDYTETGTYTRVIEEMNEEVPMAMQAWFEKGTSSSLQVKIEVRADDQLERTFYIEYAYTAEEDGGDEDGNEGGEDIPDMSYAEPAQRSAVVVVEFTGQKCQYCPNLSRSLGESEKRFGRDRYIITALHHLVDYSLLPEAHTSLYNAEAMEYALSIDIHTGLPHLAYNSLGPDIDDTPLDYMFDDADLLECTGEVQYTSANEYVVNISTRLRSDQIGTVEGRQIDILLWALENDIVAIQNDNGAWTYPAHQNIFRGSINTTWGEAYQIGKTYAKSFKIPEGVSVVANSEVIVFFLDHETRTILDAKRIIPTKKK